MKLETKYNIGDRIWVVYEPIINNEYHHNQPAGELSVFDDYISSIEINKNGILYLLKDADCMDLRDEDIIEFDRKSITILNIRKLEERLFD